MKLSPLIASTFAFLLGSSVVATETPYEARQVMKQILTHEKLSLVGKRAQLEIFKRSQSSEVLGAACSALALLGDTGVEELAKRLLKDPEREAVVAAAQCLALVGKPDSAAALSPLAFHANELVRNDAVMLLAQYEDNPIAAQALVKVIQNEKESHIVFNLIESLNRWQDRTVITAVIDHLNKQIKARLSYNVDGVMNLLAIAAEKDEAAFKVLKSALENPDAGSFLQKVQAVVPPADEKRSFRIRELLEEMLLQKKIPTWQKNGLANALVSFEDPRVLDTLAKALGRCEDAVCEDIVWSAAAFREKKATEILRRAAAHEDLTTAEAARNALGLRALKDKDKYIRGIVRRPASSGAKVDFGRYELRNSIMVAAARDKQGIRRELLEELLTQYEKTSSFEWHQLVDAYLRRFGRETQFPALLLDRIETHSVLRKPLVYYLENHPHDMFCKVTARRFAKEFDSSNAQDVILPLIRLRLKGRCLANAL